MALIKIQYYRLLIAVFKSINNNRENIFSDKRAVDVERKMIIICIKDKQIRSN